MQSLGDAGGEAPAVSGAPLNGFNEIFEQEEGALPYEESSLGDFSFEDEYESSASEGELGTSDGIFGVVENSASDQQPPVTPLVAATDGDRIPSNDVLSEGVDDTSITYTSLQVPPRRTLGGTLANTLRHFGGKNAANDYGGYITHQRQGGNGVASFGTPRSYTSAWPFSSDPLDVVDSQGTVEVAPIPLGGVVRAAKWSSAQPILGPFNLALRAGLQLPALFR